MLQKVRFITETATLYIATLAVIGYAVHPSFFANTPTYYIEQPPLTTPRKPSTPRLTVVSGTPSRIQLPDYAIDLAVIPGDYDAAGDSWTLSDTSAQFATMTAPVNNRSGSTLIYGHATEAVFGKLTHTTPPVGTVAQVTTKSHTFTYTFSHSQTLSPNDTAILTTANSGKPALIVQTCTGLFSEWRTMYYFTFSEVKKR